MNYTEEQLNEAYEKMPDNLKGILGDENLGFVIQAIGRENGITPEQSLDIEYLVVYTILELRSYDNLARNIRDDFKIKGEVAWKIARDIQKDIFSETVAENKNTNEKEKTAENISPPKVPSPITSNVPLKPPTTPEVVEKQPPVHPFEEKLKAAQKAMSGGVQYKGIPDPYRERME